MRVWAFPAQMLGTNCYVLAPMRGDRCVIVDPGIGVQADLEKVLAAGGVTPEAVLLTHGHLDHTATVPWCAETFNVPVRIHEDDEYRLTDPFTTLGPAMASMFGPEHQAAWKPPATTETFAAGDVLTYAGLSFTTTLAPGHTEGSALLTIEQVPSSLNAGDGAPKPTRTVLVGDVVFAGAVGRTDLPGGSPEMMEETLRTVIPALGEDSLLFPGHGPATTVWQELHSNPYIKEAMNRG